MSTYIVNAEGLSQKAKAGDVRVKKTKECDLRLYEEIIRKFFRLYYDKKLFLNLYRIK